MKVKKSLKNKILSIIIANTDEDGWRDMEAIGKQVVWIMESKK